MAHSGPAGTDAVSPAARTADEGPAPHVRRRPRVHASVWAALVLAVLAAATLIVAVRGVGPGQGRSGRFVHAPPDEHTGAGSAAASPATPVLAPWTGRLWLEPVPAADAEATDAADGEPPRDASARADAPLTPAPRCLARAWLLPALDGPQVLAGGGPRPAAEASCDAQGRFELRVPVGAATASGAWAVELLAPGRLRAVVQPTRAPPSSERDGPTLARDVAGGGALPEVAVGVGYRVRGQVVGIAGAPLPGVLLRARPVPDLGEPLPWWAVSDADGRFEWDSLPAGPLRIEASGPGLLPSVIEAIAPSDDVLLVADGTAPLRGEVIAAASGTRVRLAGSGIWPPRSVAVAADGSFAVADVPLGVFGIEALHVAPDGQPGAPELASVPLENLVRDELTGDVFVRLALVPAHRIPVRVLDGAGEPIAAARVVVGYDRIALLQRRAETDPTGLARVGPLVPGPYVVRAEADGWLPAELELELGDADAPEQVLRLQKPSTVRGVVVDEAGATVAGARVRVDGDVERTVDEAAARAAVFLAVRRGGGSLGVTEGPVPPIPADLAAFADALADGLIAGDERGRDALAIHTDADGAFEIGGLGPGELRLQATDGRYAASPVVRVDIASAGAVHEVRLVLGRGQPVTGVVRDTNGRPIAGASVQLDDGTLARTDARGTFDVGHRRGVLTVVVSAPGFAPARVEVRVRERAVDLALELDAADAALEGVVRDANGRPIAGATVMVRWDDGLAPSLELTSDARGVFAATRLPAGAVTLVVEGPGYGAVEVRGEARARVSPLELALVPTVDTTVVVRDEDSGRPVPDAAVQLAGRTAVTDAAGDARVVGLDGARGRWPLRVTAAGYVAAELDISADAARRDGAIRVALRRGGAIAGVVQDDLGEAVSGAAIRVRVPGASEVLARARTSGSGEFRIDGLPEGEVELLVEPPPGWTVGERVFRSFTARAYVDARPDRVTEGLVLRFDRPVAPD